MNVENGALSTGWRLNDHEARLRRVERWMYAVPLTLVSSIVAAIAAVIAASK